MTLCVCIIIRNNICAHAVKYCYMMRAISCVCGRCQRLNKAIISLHSTTFYRVNT